MRPHATSQLLRFPIAVIAALVGLLALIPVLLLGTPFWLMSVAVRLGRKAGTGLGPEAVEWREAVEYDSLFGWKTRPNLDVHLSGPAGVFHVTTDESGARGPVSLASADVVVFGDSFAFGHAADDSTFFPYLSREERIVAIGANGYNLVQALLWMESLADQLRDRLVIWLVFYGNDLYDNLTPNHQHYRMPFVRQTAGPGGWEVVTDHVDESPWPFYEIRNDQRKLAEICSGTRLTARAMSACEHLVGRGAEVCREAGARFAVLGVPEKWQLSEEGRALLRARSPSPGAFDATLPDRELQRICHDLGIRFVPLSGMLTTEDHLKDDCHWNANGQRKVSELIHTLSGPERLEVGAESGKVTSASPQAVD